ncbi:TPA: glucose PTS transporter subunit IIA [Raoultella planticola]
MNYNQTADKILHAVGGAENIRMLTHCATRLRMEFNDRARVNDAQIGTIPGVISVVEKGGQFQIVIGNEVQQVYRLLHKALPEKKSPTSGDKNARPTGIVARVISVISTTFTPVIPAITGAGMLASNVAMGAATLCVALKTKNSNLRQLASSSGFTALLGITEPALYGVLLKFRRVLIAAMIGGGCAGVYAGVSGLVRYAFVSPGLAALPAFIGENPMNIVHALVTCAISIVVTFTLTWFIAFKDVPEEQEEVGEAPQPAVSAKSEGETEVLSPLRGQVVALSEVNDDVFSGGLLGEGLAIRPEEGVLRAPFSGTVMMFLPSCHAVGLRSDGGLELLIHIGIDTVNLNGQHFSSTLKVGDRVESGQALIRFDIPAIEQAGYDLITPVIVVNGDEQHALRLTAAAQVDYGEPLMVQSAKEAQA